MVNFLHLKSSGYKHTVFSQKQGGVIYHYPLELNFHATY